jgi:ABC-type amino acid transport system permease subunit
MSVVEARLWQADQVPPVYVEKPFLGIPADAETVLPSESEQPAPVGPVSRSHVYSKRPLLALVLWLVAYVQALGVASYSLVVGLAAAGASQGHGPTEIRSQGLQGVQKARMEADLPAVAAG